MFGRRFCVEHIIKRVVLLVIICTVFHTQSANAALCADPPNNDDEFLIYNDADGNCWCEDEDDAAAVLSGDTVFPKLSSKENKWNPLSTSQYKWAKNICYWDGANFSPVDGPYYIYFMGEALQSAAYKIDVTWCYPYTRGQYYSGITTQHIITGTGADDAVIARSTTAAEATTHTCVPTDSTGTATEFKKTSELMKHQEKQLKDGTKVCVNLPWTTIGRSQCTALTHYCDRYKEAADPCVVKTSQLANNEVAVLNKQWCTKSEAAARRRKPEDKGSEQCAIGEVCVTGGHDVRCFPKVEQLHAEIKKQSRMKGGPSAGAEFLRCVGRFVGTRVCLFTEVCNPMANSFADLCIREDKVMKFGEIGANFHTKICIGNGMVGRQCSSEEVCNIAADMDDSESGDVCIKREQLLGYTEWGSEWFPTYQLKADAQPYEWCLAHSGSSYFSAICSVTPGMTTVCNPHARKKTDVCILKTKVLRHGEMSHKTIDDVEFVVDVTACLGQYFYTTNCILHEEFPEWCNEGATTKKDLCIKNAEVLLPEDHVMGDRAQIKSHNLVGDGTKYCFSKVKAEICEDTEVCNPNSLDGHWDTCIDINRVLAHGEWAETYKTGQPPLKNVCIGRKATVRCPKRPMLGNLQCDHEWGHCLHPDLEMVPGTKLETEDRRRRHCFGQGIYAHCKMNYYCNHSGTDTTLCGRNDRHPCTENHICILEGNLILQDDDFQKGNTQICLAADGSNASWCTNDELPELTGCDREKGICKEPDCVCDPAAAYCACPGWVPPGGSCTHSIVLILFFTFLW